MCLITTQSEPFIANKDITVFKWLNVYGKEYKTRFIWQKIIFTKGIAIQEVPEFRHSLYTECHLPVYSVSVGIHAIRKRIYSKDARTFIAVIPKGTPYYIGAHSDVVSLKLIIFKNIFYYLFYKIKKCFKS